MSPPMRSFLLFSVDALHFIEYIHTGTRSISQIPTFASRGSMYPLALFTSSCPSPATVANPEVREATYVDENNEHGSRSRVASLNRLYRRKLGAAIRVRALSRGRRERGERARTQRREACDSVWRGMSAIYPGIDNTQQRVAGCATQRHVADHTYMHTH